MNAAVPPPHPRRRQILGVLCLSLLAVTVDNTIPRPSAAPAAVGKVAEPA